MRNFISTHFLVAFALPSAISSFPLDTAFFSFHLDIYICSYHHQSVHTAKHIGMNCWLTQQLFGKVRLSNRVDSMVPSCEVWLKIHEMWGFTVHVMNNAYTCSPAPRGKIFANRTRFIKQDETTMLLSSNIPLIYYSFLLLRIKKHSLNLTFSYYIFIILLPISDCVFVRELCNLLFEFVVWQLTIFSIEHSKSSLLIAR